MPAIRPSGYTSPLYGNALLNYIYQRSKALALDPLAVISVAMMEGGTGGSVGDSGSSFGPFQLHEGGALPASKSGNPNHWANTTAGIQYALNGIASVARNKTGADAISAIVSKFERPSNPSAEIAGATAKYRTYLNSGVPGVNTSGSQNTNSVGWVDSAVVEFSKQFLGVPYVYGGAGPSNFDCSGLTQYVYHAFGINIPHGATDQSKLGTAVANIAKAVPGDLLFYEPGANGYFGHVTMYIGNNKMIAAPRTGENVQIQAVRPTTKIRRLINENNATSASDKFKASHPSTWQQFITRLKDPLNAASWSPEVNVPDVLGGIDAVGAAAIKATQAQTWINVAKVVGGIMCLGVGVYLMTKETHVNVPGVAEVPGVKTVANVVTTPKVVESTKKHVSAEGAWTTKTREYRSKRKGTEEEAVFTARHREAPPVQKVHHTHEAQKIHHTYEAPPEPKAKPKPRVRKKPIREQRFA